MSPPISGRYNGGMAAIDKWISDADPATPIGEVARQALALRLRNVIHFLPLAAHLADENIEYVHSARVATRRAGAALSLFRDLLPSGRRKQMKQTLKEIRSSMGDARDLDVYIQRFGKATDPAAGTLLKSLKRRRRAAQRPIIDVATPLLSDEQLRRQVARLLKKVKRHGKKSARCRPFGSWAVDQLRDEWDTFVVQVPEDEPTAEQLHQFRIAAKRFRYAIELLSQGLPGSVREVVYPQVKQLQGQLGEIQDHAVAAERLHAWRVETAESDVAAMLAQYEQDEREQYRGKCEAFIHWWRRDRIGELRTAVEALVKPSNPTPTAN